MAATDPAGLTSPRRQARRFGLELGVAALVVAVVLARRHAAGAALAAAAAGAALVACAAVRPTLLAPMASQWMRASRAISRVTTPVILTVVYLVAFTPLAWVRRRAGRSPIARARDATSYWVRRSDRTRDESRAAMERQF